MGAALSAADLHQEQLVCFLDGESCAMSVHRDNKTKKWSLEKSSYFAQAGNIQPQPCALFYMYRANGMWHFPVCRRTSSAYCPSRSSLFGRQERPARPSWVPFAWVKFLILACMLSQVSSTNNLSVTCRADGQYLQMPRGSSPQQACAFSQVFGDLESWDLISTNELKVTYYLGCCFIVCQKIRANFIIAMLYWTMDNLQSFGTNGLICKQLLALKPWIACQQCH